MSSSLLCNKIITISMFSVRVLMEVTVNLAEIDEGKKSN